MTEPDRSREEILCDLVTGELSPEAAEARALFARDPDAREEFERSQRVARALDASESFHRDLVADAAALDGAPGEERVLEVVRREAARATGAPDATAAPSSRAAGPTGHPWRWVAAAAAAALLVLAAGQLRHREQPAGPGPVLGTGVRLLAPVGTVDAYSPFEWAAERPPGGWFEVRVYDETEGATQSPLARSGRLDAPRWPGPPETTSWPETIRWDVQVFDGTGRVRVSGSAQASRSSR